MILSTSEKRKRRTASQARWRAKNRRSWNGKQTTYARTYRTRNPDKYKAQTAVGNAIRDGRLIRPTLCERCNQPGKIEAHHHDYAKPLEVEWVCPKCHGEERHE